MNRFAALALVVSLPGIANAQVTRRVNLATNGAQANAGSLLPAPSSAISDDGRFVVYVSVATNLVAGDTGPFFDVFVKDRVTGVNERVSVDSSGAQANNESGIGRVSISADGRYVAFDSFASNLVPGDTNGAIDVFVHDRQTGSTERVSLDSAGSQANQGAMEPALGADGRFVCFTSLSSDLVPGDTNGALDVFVRDLQLGTTVRASVGPGGVQANGISNDGEITPDGRFVAFTSSATNLVAGSFGAGTQIYVRDLQSGTVECVSLVAPGVGGNGASFSPSISDDGRFVGFGSNASDLFAGDSNGVIDAFVRDRLLGTTLLASATPAGQPGNDECLVPRLSRDGRWMVFASAASDLVAGDTNGLRDEFLRDLATGTTSRVSLDVSGGQSNGDARSESVSRDGRFTLFSSGATDLVLGDTNGMLDIFLHDASAAGFASTCEPGSTGIIACPCANPPSGAGRGCDNSSATGGAQLSASGVAYLSSDSLVFTTSGEKPTALSILLQGDGIVVGGVAFGQGVRCGGGSLKRLYSKNASGGSITAPDSGAGDPSVSVRSAALGTVILAGRTYAYLVYYRDPIVLGGCNPASTFNATQTGVVSWFP